MDKITDAVIEEIKKRREKPTFSAGQHNEICGRLPSNFKVFVSLELDQYETDIAKLLAYIASLPAPTGVVTREQINDIIWEVSVRNMGVKRGTDAILALLRTQDAAT